MLALLFAMVAAFLLMAAEAQARTKMAVHLGAGTDFFHQSIGRDKAFKSLPGYASLKLEMGLNWYAMKNVIVALALRPNLMFNPDTDVGLGVIFGLRYYIFTWFYVRLGIPLSFYPEFTLGLYPGMGLEFTMSRHVLFFIEVAIPIGFMKGGGKASSVGLAFLWGPRFLF